MSERLVAVDGAILSCPNAIPGVPNCLNGTCDTDATGSGNSILTAADSELGTNILPFTGCSLTPNRVCAPIIKPVIYSERILADENESTLLEGSYFTCLAGGKESKVEIVDPNQNNIYTQCKTPELETTLDVDNLPDGFRFYDNSWYRALGESVFHCSYTVILENCNPVLDGSLQREGVFDKNGNIVDENHNYRGCRGTNNQADGDINSGLHTELDVNPHWKGALTESARKAVDDAIDAVGDAVDYAIDAVGDAVDYVIDAVGDAVGDVVDDTIDAVGDAVGDAIDDAIEGIWIIF